MSNKLNQVRLYDYDPSSKRWSDTRTLLSREPNHFAVGGIRLAYRAYNCSKSKNWSAYPMVLKLDSDVSARKRQLVENDVIMQWKCISYADAYNKKAVTPKKVSYVPCQMVEFLDDREEGQFGSLEKYLEGNYVKHNNAHPAYAGHALNERNTPQAFSHFTFEMSGGREVVVDVQGVGDVYTDPQIFTMDSSRREHYGQANWGGYGIAQFFEAHRCNDICRALGLTPQDARQKRPGTGTCPVPKGYWT